MLENEKIMKSVQCRITNWRKFASEVRSGGCNLLSRLDEFPNSILVTGCQRSGTTILSRIITQSEGMVNYWFGWDDELDAALILSGYIDHELQGRYCFQTTYLNECYDEYFEHTNGHKIIWILRNPFSVVYSLLHHWRRFALNELFCGCGSQLLQEKEKRRYDLFGAWSVSKLLRACLAYNGKVSHVFELKERMGKDNILVLDYDDLVKDKKNLLPLIYRFIDLSYMEEYVDMIHSSSLNKARRLSKRECTSIKKLCMPVYEKARILIQDYY